MDLTNKLKIQLDRCRVPHFTGPFNITHGGRGYWVVNGPVPIEVAWEIYKDPASSLIRVDGHCMAPEPVDPWVKWRMPDGTELATLEDKAALEKSAHIDFEFHKNYMKLFTFSDDPEVRAKAKCFVELYHIDGELGLRVFMDYLRWYNLI